MTNPLGAPPRRKKRPAGTIRLRSLMQPQLLERTAKESPLQQRVDTIYAITQDLVLNYQSVTSGFFPRFSKDRDVGYAKDSIYCAIACWACSIAYKRMDDERGRQTELRQSAVKTMRGILFSWMQQTETLDNFKKNNSLEFALHARFDLQSGLVLEDSRNEGFGHLQMDLVALYLLALVQMISAGCKIVYTHEEVCFVQNLVFYIERTYRTPDFGMWERGTRYNQGEPELHASSLGMVKASLEAINGFNLYGSSGTSSSVIFVDIDGHNRNRTTFEAILPRESNSKNTDAALLLAVGWPAFATHDEKLFEKTLDKCIRRLEGKHGIRRFLRDGYRTEVEDCSRKYYTDHETSLFDSIESHFPMFFALVSITAKLKGEQTLADAYWTKLENSLLRDDSVASGLIVPECYCVEESKIEEEKQRPGSTTLYPLEPFQLGHHLLSNALYIIALLLKENLIHASDIDPICRRLPASQRPKLLDRHSAFQGSMEGETVVQMALVAESVPLQMMLSTYGIITQTPHEVEPIQIWPSARMVKVFECLGLSKRLGLSGRPPRPFGPLSTSKIFRVFGDTILCYPLLFEVKDFYISSDASILVENIKRDIEFVARRWKLSGRPIMCLLLREENIAGDYFHHMLQLLLQLNSGSVNGVRVRLGRVHQLLNLGCVEHIDFANPHDVHFDVDRVEESEATTCLLLSNSSLKDAVHDHSNQSEVEQLSDAELSEIIRKADPERPRATSFALAAFAARHSLQHVVYGESIRDRLEKQYRRACQLRSWWLVRFCAGQLRKTMNSLAPGITSLLVRGKQVTVGLRGHEVTISTPRTPKEISDVVFSSCASQPAAAVLQQELIMACSDVIGQDPVALEGILTIRLSWLADAIRLLMHYVHVDELQHHHLAPSRTTTPPPENHSSTGSGQIFDLSPTLVKEFVTALLTKQHWHLLTPLQTRRLNGSLNRMPRAFYDRVWRILERAKGGLVIASQFLPQQPTLSDMTQFELNFAYKIEGMMSAIDHPEYRHLLVELLCIIATCLERNPEVHFQETIDCEEMIKRAFHIYADQEHIKDRENLKPFYQLENVSIRTSTTTFLVKAVVELILNKRHLAREVAIFDPPDVKPEETAGSSSSGCVVN